MWDECLSLLKVKGGLYKGRWEGESAPTEQEPLERSHARWDLDVNHFNTSHTNVTLRERGGPPCYSLKVSEL